LGCTRSSPLFLARSLLALKRRLRLAASVCGDFESYRRQPVRHLCRTRGACGASRNTRTGDSFVIVGLGLRTNHLRCFKSGRVSGQQRRGKLEPDHTDPLGRLREQEDVSAGRLGLPARPATTARPCGPGWAVVRHLRAISTGAYVSAAPRARLHCRRHGRTARQGAPVRVPRHCQPRPAGRPVRTAPARRLAALSWPRR